MGAKDIKSSFPTKQVQIKLLEGLVMVSIIVVEVAEFKDTRNEVFITNCPSEEEARKQFEYGKIAGFFPIDFLELFNVGAGNIPEIYRNMVANYMGKFVENGMIVENDIGENEYFYFFI